MRAPYSRTFFDLLLEQAERHTQEDAVICRIEFRESLPVTDTGKVSRRKVKEAANALGEIA